MIKKSNMKLLFSIVLVSMALMLSSVVNATDTPHSFYGTVKVSSTTNAPVGTAIKAYINGEEKGSFTVETAGIYGGNGSLKDYKHLVVSGNTGDVINFLVCTVNTTQSYNFEEWGHTNLSLTISSACAVTPTTTTGGGGSGGAGAGGGGAAAEEVTAEATESQVWGAVEAGQENTMTIDNELIPVSEFSFVTDEGLTNVEVTVNSYAEKPSDFEAVPLSGSSLVYKYIKIVPENIGEGDLTESGIGFEVPLSWLNENNALPEDIIFLKFKDGKWTELAAGFISKDSVNAYFNVENPGFGKFSIGLKAKEAEKEPVEEAEEEEAEEEIEITEEIKEKEKAIGWAIAALIVIIGLVIYFWITKKKK